MIKTLFHILNIIFLIFYLYPGSILGYVVYKDFSKQPQITVDFLVSSNHVYAFALLSFLAFINYYKNQKIIVIGYLFFISIFLELSHFYIPNRGFQFSDLFGNIIGVLISLSVFNLIISWRKK